MMFGQLLRGDAVKVKRVMDKIFPGNSQIKLGVPGVDNDHGRRLFKTVLVNAYGTQERALLYS